MNNHGNNLVKDLTLVIFRVFIAVILAKTGALQDLITSTQKPAGIVILFIAQYRDFI
ncbi:MAG: hypothetical protein UT53_C0008G0011 [Candidatus Yanofskybacteria bacterium GW2011_GWD2_39_48]|uniref:Uncharacterized protein n=1 Tax=Candidatus Yanofskybacteria bacterium GW2011_GWD2_39_48 TaxID=1619031 RepID=A0A0G0PF09_9BACT|nr:MAG: hypothetical protein UT53_C0008G0011 [Candidatus Yanofskybacteria bacterium GW2011_GWD2_39_48]